MTDMPDKIMASLPFGNEPAEWSEIYEWGFIKCGCEYIRADLVPRWQPIETAPKDGTFFLMRRKNREPVVVNQPKGCAIGVWHKINGRWGGSIHGGDGTHWMPLPEPPEGGE